MIGFIANIIYVVGTIAFFSAFILLFINIKSNRCLRCHEKMIDEGNLTIFEGAKSIDGNTSFPPLYVRRHVCSSCRSQHLELYTPNMAKSVVRFYAGDNIKQYIHVSDSEILKRFEDNLRNNNLGPIFKENEDFTSCLNQSSSIYHQQQSNLGIAISKEAFAEIYQMAKKYVENANKISNQISN